MDELNVPNPAQIKRSELKKFLPTDDLIRRFERLLRVAGETTPQAVNTIIDATVIIEQQVVELVNTIISTEHRSPQALDLIDRLRVVLELGSLSPPASPSVDADSQVLDWILFRENPRVADQRGIFRWNEAAHCPEYVTGLGNVIQIGEELWGLVVNKTGGTATDGKVVYANGVQGQRITFDYADARDADKVSLVGVVTAPIDKNQEGPITTFGLVRGLDTSAWPDNTKLYIAADATGDLTSTPPSAPNFRIWVATVTYQHAIHGSMFVSPRLDFADGVTIEDLHVRTTLTSGDIAGGNYLSVEPDGTDERMGEAVQWDDISGELIAARLDTASGRLAYDYFNAGVSFQSNARYPGEPVLTPIQGKHSMLLGAGAVARPHVHWLQQQSGVPNWLLAYKITNYGDTTTFETDFTNYTLLPWDSNVYTYVSGTLAQITMFPEIDISSLELSGSVDVVLFRDTANASGEFAGADPVAVDVTAKYLDSHVKFNMIGSREEYSK